MTNMIEAVARAVFAENGWWRVVLDHDDGKGRYSDMAGTRMRAVEWEEIDAEERDSRLREARAAIAGHEAALSESGFVIVPREPTEEMVDAGYAWQCTEWPEDWHLNPEGITSETYIAQNIWPAMLSAALKETP